MYRTCQRIHRIIVRKKRYVTAFLLVLVVYIVFFTDNPLQSESYLEVAKCPACFGKGFCPQLLSGNITLVQKSVWNIFSIRNVYFAQDGEQEIVLKKLGHNSELEELDHSICSAAGETSSCSLSESIGNHAAFKTSNYRIPVSSVVDLSDMVRCPSQRLVDRMMEKYRTVPVSKPFLSKVDKMNLITTLMMNSEPLILQTFPQEDGWPFPKYLGACGRFVAVEKIGEELSNYYNSPWDYRIDLAYQIFLIADQMTQNDLGFALYWVDLSYENLAVDRGGRVFIVDAENILVVDLAKVKREKPLEWDKPLVSRFDDCKEYGTCISFSPDRLCSRYQADHNYYTVCRNLLSSYGSDVGKPGGLLHDMPAFAKNKYKLEEMLNECAKPTKPNGRFLIKDKLLFTLDELRKVDW